MCYNRLYNLLLKFEETQKGEMREMRKLAFVIGLTLMSVSISGCTAKSAGNESNTNITEDMINVPAVNEENDMEAENDKQTESQAGPEDTIQNWDNIIL